MCEFHESTCKSFGDIWWTDNPIYFSSIAMECGSSAVECRTRNQVSPGSNPPLLPFRSLGIFVLSIDAPVDSAVYMSTWLQTVVGM